jgi:tetratricopeptide (TPR) repeat protein
VRTGDVRRELDGRMWRLISLLEFGRVAEAEAELGRYERLAERLGQPEFLFFARSRRATLATLRGRFEEAERLTRTAYDLAVTAGLPDALNVLVGQLGTIATARGTAAMEALATEEWLGERLRAAGGPPLLIRAQGLLAAGRREEARDLFRAGLSAADFPPPSRWLFLWLVVELAYGLGELDAARSVHDELLRYADRFVVAAGAVLCGGAASRLLGLCALTLGQPDEAVGWLRQAVASNRRVGAAPFVARAQAELATALRRRNQAGDAEEARRLLAEAAEAAAELGMAGLAGDIAALQAEDAEAGPDRPRLRRDGQDWLLSMSGRSTRLRHSKGLAQLAMLLANPGREVSAVELAGGIPAPAAPDPVLDEPARRAYRQRLAELDAALEGAAARGDTKAAGRLEAERAALVAELKRASGLGGRRRGFSDEAERARVNVTRTIRQALNQILAADPEAGRLLMRSVRTGIRCVYRPNG